MKNYTIILLILFISFIHCGSLSECERSEGRSAKECKGLEVGDGYKYCCYLEYELLSDTYKICQSLTEAEYNDINKTKTVDETIYGKVNKLDCNSNFLKISLLSLLLIIL